MFYGEGCPGLQKIMLGTGTVCQIADDESNLSGECRNYSIYFEEEKCPYDSPKCEFNSCRGAFDLVDVICDGSKIDPLSSLEFCGASGNCEGDKAGEACVGGRVCQVGVCACPSGQITCDGICVDAQTNGAYCGAKDDCIDGNAGIECPADEICKNGRCLVTCAPGQIFAKVSVCILRRIMSFVVQKVIVSMETPVLSV